MSATTAAAAPAESAAPAPIYTLGLGQVLPSLPPDKRKLLRAEEQEEQLFMQRERERAAEAGFRDIWKDYPIHKKTTYTKTDRTGAIRRLLAGTQPLKEAFAQAKGTRSCLRKIA